MGPRAIAQTRAASPSGRAAMDTGPQVPGGSLGGIVLGAVERLKLDAVALTISRLVAQHGVLGPLSFVAASARRLARFRLIEPYVDGDYYVRQLPEAWRVAARRDAVLHYGLVGCFRGFSPFPGFDPIFYRADNPDLSWGRDPLAHYARRRLAAAAPDAPIATSPLALRRPFASADVGRPLVVTVSHARGGGSERYLRLYERMLIDTGHGVTRLARDTIKAPLFQPMPLDHDARTAAVFHILHDEDGMTAWLRESGATRLVINHIVDLPFETLARLPDICRAVGIPFDVILHDYLVLCPRINLVDRTRRLCDGPSLADCDACVSDRTGLTTEIRPAAWRQATGQFLRHADRVIAPHEDLVRRLSDYWPDLPVEVWEPEPDAGTAPPRPTRLDGEAPLRIGIIGALNVPKGFDVVKRIAAHARAVGLPLQFVLVGTSSDNAGLTKAGVQVTGRYREVEAQEAIRRQRLDIVFVPAIWPETWSFTLSLALAQRLPVYAFDIGAVAGRLRRLGLGTLLPPTRAEDPDWLANVFVAARQRALVHEG